MDKIRVLLIEDDQAYATAVTTWLQEGDCRYEYEVIHASSHAESEKMYQAAGVLDLILLDLHLNNGKGVDLVAAIYKLAGGAGQPPIVVLTNADITDEDRHRMDQYIIGFIFKSDVGPSVLRFVLRQAYAEAKMLLATADAKETSASVGRAVKGTQIALKMKKQQLDKSGAIVLPPTPEPSEAEKLNTEAKQFDKASDDFGNGDTKTDGIPKVPPK